MKTRKKQCFKKNYLKKKRCQFCDRWYKPDPRTAIFQKSCGNKSCSKQRKQQSIQNWNDKHPQYHKYNDRAVKVRSWAAETNYWKRYRATHPEYVRKDNKRRVLSRKHAKEPIGSKGPIDPKVSAKQNTISQITVDKLNSIRINAPDLSAKQVAIDRRINSLIDVLIWKEVSAKQINIDFRSGCVP